MALVCAVYKSAIGSSKGTQETLLAMPVILREGLGVTHHPLAVPAAGLAHRIPHLNAINYMNNHMHDPGLLGVRQTVFHIHKSQDKFGSGFIR